MKAAIYTRVSTFDQANGYSLDMQDKLAISYCQQHDIEVYKHYSDEITGAKMDRPSLRQLLADAENHCFNFVIVHKLDRLSRSQKDTLHIIEDIFLKNDINFISLSENFDTRTPVGKALVGMLAVFAQFGYDYIDEQYQPNEYSRWVRYIFDHFLIGDTINTIANDMTDRKILNKHWYYTTVKWILENPVERDQIRERMQLGKIGRAMRGKPMTWSKCFCPFYIGMIRWRGELYQGSHTPIVTKEVFYEAQKMLDKILKKEREK